MNDRPLAGVGVLVTRPEHQGEELKDAIKSAGGQAVMFPAMDISPRDTDDIERELASLWPPDMVIFVSANAVRHGIAHIGRSAPVVAAIGPATTQALETAGVRVHVTPEEGIDSEHLLATPALTEVAGKTVIIVRGDSGRELLANELRERGAQVGYLSVYRRHTCTPTVEQLQELTDVWTSGKIGAVMIMSIASLDSLLDILPAHCLELLPQCKLVAPSSRVIQTALERIPGITGILSPGPGALDMTGALIAALQPDQKRIDQDRQQ